MASPATLTATFSNDVFGYDTSSYVTARDTGWGVGSQTYDIIGQRYRANPDWRCNEMFLEFDTGSEVPDGATVTVATLKLNVKSDQSVTDFTIKCAAFDWGTGDPTTADFRTAAQLAALSPLLASLSTSGIGTGQKSLTSEAAFLSAINKTDVTRLIVWSSRHENGDEPTGNEYLEIYGYDYGSNEPELYLEYTTGATIPIMAHHYRSLRG